MGHLAFIVSLQKNEKKSFFKQKLAPEVLIKVSVTFLCLFYWLLVTLATDG
jgi:hypothetical protein